MFCDNWTGWYQCGFQDFSSPFPHSVVYDARFCLNSEQQVGCSSSSFLQSLTLLIGAGIATCCFWTQIEQISLHNEVTLDQG